MSIYPDNYDQEELFGLGYPTGGMISAAADETRTRAVARLLSAMLGSLGTGIFEGMLGAVVDGGLEISAGTALVSDDLGAVPISAGLEALLDSAFAAGSSNYVHVQADETARADGACGYLVSPSATPPPGGLLVCQVTKSGGVVTAVDNGVRLAPALEARLTWAGLVTAIGGTETLGDVVAAEQARLDNLEATVAGGGGGGGTASYLSLLLYQAGSSVLAPQWIKQQIDAAISAAGTGGSETGTAQNPPVERWDELSWNFGQATMRLVALDPDLPIDYRNTATVVAPVDGVGGFGHGERGGVDFVDPDSDS
jgi:hypothetical protein